MENLVVSSTPLRISFVGGGTDFKEFYERKNFYGQVISAAINFKTYCFMKKKNNLNVKNDKFFFDNNFQKSHVYKKLIYFCRKEGIKNKYDDLEYVNDVLDYNFESEKIALEYYEKLIKDINNFGLNVVYYGNDNDIYDSGDNYLRSFGYNINNVPNMSPEIIKIMDDYLEYNTLK